MGMDLWGHVISIFSLSNIVSSLTRLCKIIWSKPSEFPLIRTSLTLFLCTRSLSSLAHHTFLRHKPKKAAKVTLEMKISHLHFVSLLIILAIYSPAALLADRFEGSFLKYIEGIKMMAILVILEQSNVSIYCRIVEVN